jgi:hypothetical protein
LRKAIIMESITYQLTVKKEYAYEILENLQLDEAIEMIPNDIPQWQITESRRRLVEMKANPHTMLDSDTFFNSIDADAE